MKTLKVGEIAITSLIERDGPWRTPEAMFPAYDPGARPQASRGARPDRVRSRQRPHGDHLPDVPRPHAQTYGPDRHLHRRGQRLIPPLTISPSSRGSTVSTPPASAVEDITHVFCTHLHFDHTGWNTMLRDGRWTPTFPNAKYIFHRGEYERWEAITARGDLPPGLMAGKLPGNSWSYNCRPIVEAGQALLVDDTFQLDDNFTLVPTPGHSPCHCCVRIRSQGQEAVVTGDMMHHALQCREPDWSTIFDFDPVQAAQSRRRFLSASRRHRDAGAADPFPEPDRRPGRGRRRSLPLYVRAVERIACSGRHRERSETIQEKEAPDDSWIAASLRPWR